MPRRLSLLARYSLLPVTRRTQFRLLVALTIVWAAWAGWSLLGRATPYELQVVDDLGEPVAAAIVDIEGTQVGTSDDAGRIPMEWDRSSTVLEVSAPGHVPLMLTVAEAPEGVVDVVLKARVLRGRVVDDQGVGVLAAVVTTEASSAVTDAEGHFIIRGAEPGEVSVRRPAWQSATFEWDGGGGEALVELSHFSARAVHITGPMVQNELARFIEMARSTELNALMIDLKDEKGHVYYRTSNETAIEVGADKNAYDLETVVDLAHNENLYVIGRIVLFNDPITAKAKPSMAIWDSAANGPFESRGQFFLDPTDPDARRYGLQLAVEACEFGIDEIQFDYVRFPDRLTDSAVLDQGVGDDVRVPTISGFLAEAVSLLHPMGCAVAADIFGFLTTARDDGFIGQQWEEVAMIVDVVSPMVYPSHYSANWYGFENPNDNPGPMVKNALEDGIERLPRNVVVRPWLQDFGYDASQVRAQIDSAEYFGLGWMLWNAVSEVTVGALLPVE